MKISFLKPFALASLACIFAAACAPPAPTPQQTTEELNKGGIEIIATERHQNLTCYNGRDETVLDYTLGTGDELRFSELSVYVNNGDVRKAYVRKDGNIPAHCLSESVYYKKDDPKSVAEVEKLESGAPLHAVIVSPNGKVMLRGRFSSVGSGDDRTTLSLTTPDGTEMRRIELTGFELYASDKPESLNPSATTSLPVGNLAPTILKR